MIMLSQGMRCCVIGWGWCRRLAAEFYGWYNAGDRGVGPLLPLLARRSDGSYARWVAHHACSEGCREDGNVVCWAVAQRHPWRRQIASICLKLKRQASHFQAIEFQAIEFQAINFQMFFDLLIACHANKQKCCGAIGSNLLTIKAAACPCGSLASQLFQ